MKILIVDDNVAVQEILKDILSEVGHNVRLAGSIEEAVEKTVAFLPDAVMLDSQIDGEEGLNYISQAKKALNGETIRVILIKSASEVAPKDVPEVVGCIDKPFKSTEIISAVDGLTVQDPEGKAAETSKKKKRKLFSRKKRQAVPEIPDGKVQFGKSYVFFEQVPDTIYRFGSMFNPDNYSIIVFTSDRPKAVKERLGYAEIEVVPLTNGSKAGAVDIRAVGTISDMACSFIAEHDRPVVIFDSLKDLTEANGLSLPLMMVQEVLSSSEKEFTLALSADGEGLTDKDREILLHNMIEYKERY